MIASEIVGRTAVAAFASRPGCGIVAWNEAAESMLGYRNREVVGQPCHELLAGRDVFGNRFCGDRCAIVRMALRREVIERFEVLYRHKSGRSLRASVTVLVVPNGELSKVDLVHLLVSFDTELSTSHREEAVSSAGAAVRRQPRVSEKRPVRLTPRELEVLKLLADGLGTGAIAARLNISASTARNHIQSILKRFEVHSRLAAVAAAGRHDFV